MINKAAGIAQGSPSWLIDARIEELGDWRGGCWAARRTRVVG